MENIRAPRVDTGQVVTLEGVMVWFRRGLSVFLFLVIIALVMNLPLPGPGRDWHDPESQPSVETAVSGPSQVVHITVRAAIN